jgi:hypothetical protein
MRGRQPEPLRLKPKDARELQRLVREGHTPQRVAQRAPILLAYAQAKRRQQVVSKVDQHRTTVWRVCQRYRQAGLSAALYDAPRAGWPRVFSPPPTPTD